jgi:hypothetical protein
VRVLKTALVNEEMEEFAYNIEDATKIRDYLDVQSHIRR